MEHGSHQDISIYLSIWGSSFAYNLSIQILIISITNEGFLSCALLLHGTISLGHSQNKIKEVPLFRCKFSVPLLTRLASNSPRVDVARR
mmetsp:Transcript_21455/g.41051  ORF Transcript_21455/g.41051 Transcript_21455/m.41051 type:complete len:89 (-) Transcript_21455:1168-1434(-)